MKTVPRLMVLRRRAALALNAPIELVRVAHTFVAASRQSAAFYVANISGALTVTTNRFWLQSKVSGATRGASVPPAGSSDLSLGVSSGETPPEPAAETATLRHLTDTLNRIHRLYAA